MPNTIQYLEIDSVNRKITLPADLLLGVLGDKNVERVHFRVKKMVGDNINLAQHQIYVKYVASLDMYGENFAEEMPGMYYCDDVTDNGDTLTFSWKMGANVFKSAGFIAFSILASDGEVTRWNTRPAVGAVKMTIPGGLPEVAEKYPDVITQLLNRMDAVEAIATPQAMQNYVDTYLTTHPVQLDSTLKDPRKAAPADAVGALKEDLTKLDTSFNQHVNNHPSDGSGAVNPQDIEKAVNDYMVKNPVKVTETDPTVPQWAKEPTKPTYTASEVGALPSDTKIPTKLPNPQKLTFQGAVTAEYDGSGAVTVTIPSGGASGTAEVERIEKLATDTTVELTENKLYIFPEMASLTYTLKAPTKNNVANEYHFVFKSGASATQLVHAVGVNIGNFKVEPNKIYEVSIMEDLLTSQSWAVV